MQRDSTLPVVDYYIESVKSFQVFRLSNLSKGLMLPVNLYQHVLLY